MRRGDWLGRTIFIVSGMALSFLLGSVLVFFGKPPSPQLAWVRSFSIDLAKNGYSYFLNKPSGHIEPARFPRGTPNVTGDPRASEGYVFLTGLFGNELGAKLVDNDGNVVHRWPIDFFKVRPEKMNYRFHALVHGSWLYPNGDILINLDGRGLYRVSRCGEILWSNENHSHHSIFVDDDDYIWTPIFGDHYTTPEFVSSGVNVDKVGKFDPDTGELVAEIDLVEMLVAAGEQGVALTGRLDTGDLLHLNDVELLSRKDAAKFPGLSAGDLMLSLRNTNQIWILDGRTWTLKWVRTGPATGQHDPDFQTDGTITVFDNRPSGPQAVENNFLGPRGGSRIIALRPDTLEYATVVQSAGDFRFFSPYRGKHQKLDNGNFLVAETDAGRAFEVTPEGEVVWSYINWWDSDEVGWIMGATRYSEPSVRFLGSACPD